MQSSSIVVAPLQIWLGDGAGRSLFANQPAKGAALEGHWRTNPAGKGAAWALVAWPDKASQENAWEIDVPDLLSLFATRTLDGRVAGLGDFARADQPPALPLIFYAFRLMVAIGFWFLGLMCWTVWLWWRGARRSQPLERHRGCLRAWFLSIPLGYVAVLCGWVVREVGRQPWTVYGLLRSGDGASALPPASVAASLGLYMTIYAALFVAFLVFARRLVVQGPDMALTPPPSQGAQ
jgi:cytochrome d ubiquinol oxidase subunit I